MKVFCLLLCVGSFLYQPAQADSERPLKRGREGWTGNERSERPGPIAPGEVRFRGNGCPEGTMRVAFAPDFLSFSVLFDKFVAESDPSSSSGRIREAMNCVAVLGFQIPEGMQMEISRVDLRGFAAIPRGARGVLRTVFNFVDRPLRGPGRLPGMPGRFSFNQPLPGERSEDIPNQPGERDKSRMVLRYLFDGPLSENYELSSGLVYPGGPPPVTEVSPCGGLARLRIRNELRLQSSRSNPSEKAMLTLDSIDGRNNTIYFVNWRKCSG